MSRLTGTDLDRLARELASYARCGVPMPAGLRRLESALRPGPMRDTVAALSNDLERGTALSDALARAGTGVPRDFVAMVRCGEIAGDLSSILQFSLDQSRRIKRHRSALITAMVYPVFVLLTLVAVTWIVMTLIVPRMKDIFQQLGAQLPGPTQFVMDLAAWVNSPAGAFVILLLLAVPLLIVVNGRVRDRFAEHAVQLPGMRGLVALSDTALYMNFVSRMVSRSVPLPEALRAASMAVWLKESRAALLRMSTAAEQGNPVSAHLSPDTPSTAAWLFARGEERGDLPAVCEGIAADCEERFDRLSKRAVAVLEPLLILLVALGVAYLLISLYLPLFSIPKIVGRE